MEGDIGGKQGGGLSATGVGLERCTDCETLSSAPRTGLWDTGQDIVTNA